MMHQKMACCEQWKEVLKETDTYIIYKCRFCHYEWREEKYERN